MTNNPPQGGGNSKIMSSATIQAVTSTLEALQADEYIIRLIHQTKAPISKQIEAAKLIHEISFYRAKNFEGYNVYFRPVGYQFILLDDLSRDTLPELAKLKPCLLIETSPKNYQAWLRLKEIPQGREQALQTCKELAARLSADMGSAEPDHIGRLPGFTNRKPKHQKPDGLFPFVELKKWENRDSEFSPQGGIVGQTTQTAKPLPTTKTNDRSREDFNLCCMLMMQGKSDEYIRQELERHSSKAKEVRRSYDYIGKTIKNARIRTRT
ncbi:MAG: RepB family DNA primase [Bacteroidetes bacterium]|nr:RepB family DNA primase [Bacteroidota bacterium]